MLTSSLRPVRCNTYLGFAVLHNAFAINYKKNLSKNSATTIFNPLIILY